MRELDTVSPVVWPAWCYSGEGQSETDSAGATEIQQAPSVAAATTAKPRRRRGGAGAAGTASGRGDSGMAPSGSVKAERLSPSSGGGSSRGSVSPGGGAATPSSSSAASTYPGTPPGERGSPSAGGGTAGAPPPPPSLPSPHPPPLQHTPALKQMEQMMTRNYSDFMRSLAAKYNNSNPNDYFSAPRNGFLSGLDSRYTPFKASSAGAFPGLAPIPTTAARGSSATPPTPPPSSHHASASSSAVKESSAQDRGVPQYNLYSASATFPANPAAFQHPLIDMSSTQALISMVRSASAQSASQLETYLKGAAGAFKRPAPSPADPTASTSSAVAAAAAAASSSSPLDLSSSSSSSTASSSTASSSSSAVSNTSASCSLAMASMLAAAAAASACKKARTSEPVGKGAFLLGGGLAGSPLLPHAPLIKGEALEDAVSRKDARKGVSSISPRPRGPTRTLPTPPPPSAAVVAVTSAAGVSSHLPPPPPPPPPPAPMHHRASVALSGASPCMSLCTDASKPCSGSLESSGGDPREAVARWSVEDVCAFVSSIDICAEYAAVFRDQRIDGSALPLLTEEHLTSALAMKLGPALKLRAALARRLGHCAVCLHCVHCHGTPPQPMAPALPAAAPKPPTPATTPSPAPTPPAAAPAPSAPSPAASPAPATTASPATSSTSAAGGRSPPVGE